MFKRIANGKVQYFRELKFLFRLAIDFIGTLCRLCICFVRIEHMPMCIQNNYFGNTMNVHVFGNSASMKINDHLYH